MSDIEMVKLCATAMGYQRVAVSNFALPGFNAAPPFVTCSLTGTSMDIVYNPLHDDEQCFARVKRLKLNIGQLSTGDAQVFVWVGKRLYQTDDEDLHRAICVCIATMQYAKAAA